MTGTAPDFLAAKLAEFRTDITAAVEAAADADPAALSFSAGVLVSDAGKLLAALGAVLALHARQEAPTRCWDLDLRCKVHYVTTDPIPAWESVRDCPDCTYRERHYCTHCDHSEYPCPTVQATTRELTGKGGLTWAPRRS